MPTERIKLRPIEFTFGDFLSLNANFYATDPNNFCGELLGKGKDLPWPYSRRPVVVWGPQYRWLVDRGP